MTAEWENHRAVGETRSSVQVLEGPNGRAEVFELLPPGRGVGDAKYEIAFGRHKLRFPTKAEAVAEAADLVGIS